MGRKGREGLSPNRVTFSKGYHQTEIQTERADFFLSAVVWLPKGYHYSLENCTDCIPPEGLNGRHMEGTGDSHRK